MIFHFKMTKVIYSPIQSGALAHADLKQHLAKYDYFPYHKKQKTTFTLMADDFQISYFSKCDADHLLNALKDKYKIKTDWEGAG